MQKKDLLHTNLPQSSGVYFFKDSEGTILYIGKATNLYDRVRSYFGDDLVTQRGKRLVDMVALAKTVEYTQTESVLEALILEANLISKHHPKYNAIGKDDKSFFFVVITQEKFPRVLIVRGRDLEKKVAKKELQIKKKFGPFPHGSQLKEALRIIRKIFPFNDRDSVKKDQSEFYKQINLAPDLSVPEIQKSYNEAIDNIVLFFKGEKKQIIKNLRKKMDALALELRFEEANIVKKQIFSLEHIRDISLIKKELKEYSGEEFRIEGFDIAHISGTHMVGVMTVLINGQIDTSQYRKFIIRNFTTSNDIGALDEMVRRRMGHPEWTLPGLFVVDGSLPQKSCVEKILREMGIVIPVVAVVKNEKHKPKGILGLKKFTEKYKEEILLVNGEAHRYAVSFHRSRREKL